MLRGCNHHHHLAAFHFGLVLDLDFIGQRITHFQQHGHAELLVRHFAPTEAQGDLDLVAFLEESLNVGRKVSVALLGLLTALADAMVDGARSV